MRKILLSLIVSFICSVAIVQAQTTAAVADTQKAAITQTALDYIEGWYMGDVERMERALHPN